ncbi:MAG: hypothetical protein KDC69_09760 [Flavobacteriaceae bacterium]|nr:hypothetical protein [Flavobacteriaceae bacterium]
MKPLIFEFKEKPAKTLSEVEALELVSYSESMNLSVVEGTNKPAVLEPLMDTQTVTRTSTEETDTDFDIIKAKGLKTLMETLTNTLVSGEGVDDDKQMRKKIFIKNLVETRTITESQEETDSDK